MYRHTGLHTCEFTVNKPEPDVASKRGVHLSVNVAHATEGASRPSPFWQFCHSKRMKFKNKSRLLQRKPLDELRHDHRVAHKDGRVQSLEQT